MKVLLIGEYSGVHVNLKKGLAKTHPEVQVTLVSNGDRFKNFDRDIDIRGYESNLYLYTATRLIKELNFILQSDKFYDVIQIINPDIFSRFLPLQWVYKILRKKCNKFILLAAGDDYYFWKAYREGIYEYSPHKSKLEIDFKQKYDAWEITNLKSANENLLKMVDLIIPMAIEYDLAYRFFERKAPIHPFPINIDEIPQIYKEKEDDIFRAFHGIQIGREGFKGSFLINDAMNSISIAEPKFEYLIASGLPYKEYVKLIQKADLILDQTFSFGPGINALISMMQGKVVAGGCEQIYMESMNLKFPPLINIKPDVASIKKVVLDLFQHQEELQVIGKEAQEFVKNHHNYSQVASQFMNTWEY